MQELEAGFGENREVVRPTAASLINDKHHEPASGQLVAGRQLDALIAEKVMGEPYPAPITDYPWWSSAPVMSPREQWVASVHPDGSDPARHVWVPRYYSTHIPEAWLVVEKLRESGWCIGIRIDDEPWDTQWVGCYGVALLGCNRGRTDATDIRVTAETLPEAVCLAALKSLEFSAVGDTEGDTRES